MSDILMPTTAPSVKGRLRYLWWWQIAGAFVLLGVSALVGLISFNDGPSPSLLAWLILYLLVGATIYRPHYGVYIIVGLTLVSDRVLLYWFPFVKNLSSYESLLYVNDKLIFSPLEIFIMLTACSWLGRLLVQRQRINLFTGPLFWPALVFIGFMTYALAYGILRRGDLTIALWEVRAIYYLVAMLILVSNLIKTRGQVTVLIWVAAAALVVKSIFGTGVVANELKFAIGSVDRIGEHAMSIHFNSLFIFLIAAYLFRAHPSWRLVLPWMLPCLILSYLANNRRASFIALGVAIVLLGVVLYRERRRLFWKIAPPFTVIALVYLAVFWNNQGPLGLPANAVKSVIGEPDERDASSNLYRFRENLNIMFTIKTAPLRGVGFGNKFFIIAPMADISFFVWWEYITHNSILWIWMKTGLGGFLSMTYLVGASLIVGGRTVRLMPTGQLRAIALSAVLYLVMHFVFAYVDMSWDTGNMVYVGSMMGLVNALPAIVARPLPETRYRWPWQEQADAAPRLVPFGKLRV